MKKLLILLSVMMLVPIMSFSQTISQDTSILISPTQLKCTNIIFAEHEELLQENELLQLQLTNIQQLNRNLIQMDTLRVSQIDLYNQQLEQQQVLNTSLKQDVTTWKLATGVVVIIDLILAVVCLIQ